MKIQIISATSVADGAGHRYASGQVADVDDDLAKSWIAAGHAKATDKKASGKRQATRQAPRTAESGSGPKAGAAGNKSAPPADGK